MLSSIIRSVWVKIAILIIVQGQYIPQVRWSAHRTESRNVSAKWIQQNVNNRTQHYEETKRRQAEK